jgi:DNA-binding NtrC family response regulator
MKKLLGKAVLVVDDDDDARAAIVRTFDMYGADVHEASGPETAAKRAGELELDLLVTDVVLPERSGMALARQVLDQRPDLPVLFISGYADSGVVLEGVSEEQVAFVAKPMSVETLARTAAELMGVDWDED